MTQRAKALFLDGNEQGAIDYFKAELEKREKKAKDRKDLIVELYNNVMSKSGDQKLTFAEFKEKHEDSALFTKRLMQQAFAVRTLDSIVRSNDYEGIDNAFNLYMVLQQEHDLSRTSIKLNKAGKEQLKQVRQRRADLTKLVHAEDY